MCQVTNPLWSCFFVTSKQPLMKKWISENHIPMPSDTERMENLFVPPHTRQITDVEISPHYKWQVWGGKSRAQRGAWNMTLRFCPCRPYRGLNAYWNQNQGLHGHFFGGGLGLVSGGGVIPASLRRII